MSAISDAMDGIDPSRDQRLAALLLISSLAILVAALIAEYVFGLEPCSLCVYQRIPYLIAVLFAGAALMLPGDGRRTALALCAVVFLAGAGLAFFHVGVEQHWWTSSIPGCGADNLTSALPETLTIDQLQQLAAEPVRRCDEVDGRIFGLSLATHNTLLSLALAALTIAGLRTGARRVVTA